jgi:nitrous oxidase accessory protein NosD
VVGLTIEGNLTRYGSGIEVGHSTGVTITRNLIRANHSFGVFVDNSGDVLIATNEITANDTGVEVEYGLAGTAITDNYIHDNLTNVDSSRGKDGVNVYYTTGATTITDNYFGHNGTHVEYYASSNITISENTMRDGSVLESGTDKGGSCRNIRFVRNVADRTDFGVYADGLILRCAANSLIANNTLSSLDMFAFDVVDGTKGVAFGGSIAGLVIENNIVVKGRAFSIDNKLPAGVVIDRNLVWGTSRARFGTFVAYVAGRGNTGRLAEFTGWTGYQAHGITADPKFSDDLYNLSPSSPAIDRGARLAGIAYSGVAPDLGRWER